ncbi:cell wall-binding repeat-containing protein [Metaclostridioides mangenotii]|uniref:Cell wall-binding protein n=1 Tax=Metaclostridioides mangenotii TaxID=1540 RepID=A0ABS4E796_9FIRM|nr:cell wall-binding repeat-containing protein [Clostridioides mangenotii]MBP1853814.1 putative cell wall-binding protein [Clostridioides mangenotii]
MNKRIKKILSATLALNLILTTLSLNTFAEDKKELPKEPTETTVTVDKFVPRIGNEITFNIDNFGYENTEDSIGSDYRIEFSNFEETDKYNPDFINIDSFQLEKVHVPNITVEKFKDGKWINTGTNSSFRLFLRKTIDEVKNSITKPNEKQEITISRDEIMANIEKNNSYLGELYKNILYMNTLNENGDPEIKIDNYNRVSNDGPFKVTYKVVDKPTKKPYGTLNGVAEWYKNGDINNHMSKAYPINWLYYETSDIKLSLSEAPKVFKPGDTVKLKVEIQNFSENIPNSRLMSGVDFGEKEIIKNPVKTEGNPDVELKYGENNSNVIPGTIQPGDTKILETEIKIPEKVSSKYLNKVGKLVLTPFLLTSNINNFTGENAAYKHLEEREYNEPLVLDFKNNSGGGGGTIDPPVNPPASSKTVILASGEKYTDVLTATVLGNEKDAPILLSTKDSVDNNTMAEIKRINPEEVLISGGVDSVSEKVVSQLLDYKVTRIAGSDRYETAKKIGNEIRNITGNKTSAMLVDGTNFPDVITMSTLASQKRVPILLTDPSELSKTTKDTIKTWAINDITIGGSYNSVSKVIEDGLDIDKVSRLGGADRYEMAELIGTEVRSLTGNKADMILVDGTNFPDGITINSLASRYKAPIMLTEPDHLNKITSEKINGWSIKNVLIGGGYNSVSKNLENNLGVSKKERVAGEDRYETAVRISQRLSEVNIGIGEK